MNKEKSNVSRSLFFSFLRRYVVTALQFISVVWLARLLTPEQIGIYTVGAAVMGIAHTVRDFGIGQYLVQEKQLSKNKVANALGLTTLTAWLMGALVFATAPMLASYYAEPLVESVMRVTAINFFIVPLGSMTPPLMKRGMGFGALLKIATASTATSTIVVIVLAYLGFGVMSLAWSSLAGTCVTAIAGQILLPRKYRVFPRLNNPRPILRFGSFILGSNFTTQFGNGIPDLMIGKVAGFSVLGLFSRANGYLNIFTSLIGKAVLPVVHAYFAQLGRKKGDLPGAYYKSLNLLTLFAWFILALMAVYSRSAIFVLFGSQWIDAAPAASLLCIAGMLRILTRINDQAMVATGQVKFLFIANCVFNVAKIIFIFVTLTYGLTAIAASVVVSFFVKYLVSTILVWNIIRDQRGAIFYAIFRNFLIVLMSIAPIALLYFRVGENFEQALVFVAGQALLAGLLSLSIFVLLIYRIKHDLAQEMSLTMKTVRNKIAGAK